MSEAQDRIQQIIDFYFNGNLNKACREFDIPQSSLINVVKGKRNKPSFDNIYKIASNLKYPINLQWLILGVGEISDTKSLTIIESSDKEDYKSKYENSKDEIIRLQAKINYLYELQINKK
jgi:hypothetical protein